MILYCRVKLGETGRADDVMKELLYRRQYRESHGLNYMELANELQIPYTTLTGMLHKKRIPRIDTIDRKHSIMSTT